MFTWISVKHSEHFSWCLTVITQTSVEDGEHTVRFTVWHSGLQGQPRGVKSGRAAGWLGRHKHIASRTLGLRFYRTLPVHSCRPNASTQERPIVALSGLGFHPRCQRTVCPLCYISFHFPTLPHRWHRYCVGEPTAISQPQSIDYYSRALRPFPTNRATIVLYSRL